MDDTTDIAPPASSGVGRLDLDHDLNTLEFEFGLAPQSATGNVRYLYRLEGLEDTWVDAKDRRYVRYPGLGPGQYIFRVRAVATDGTWPDSEFDLPVLIFSPWWATPIAFVVYGSLLIAVLVGGFRLYIKEIKLEHEVEMERFQLERVAEVDKLKSRFFANISHEFRTPLTLILGPAKQASESTREPETRQRLNVIKENARKLAGLVNQLLDFSRVESGTMKLQVSRGDLVGFLRKEVESFEPWAERKKIRLKFTSELDCGAGYFDGEKIEKIMNNLLSNALKFTPENGQVDVVVKRREKAESDPALRPPVEISVTDTGPGIGAEHLPRIFERFYRFDETHATEGTGIGLALVKELVDLHHGMITVESRPGAGSQFVVTIPFDQTFYSKDEIGTAITFETPEHPEEVRAASDRPAKSPQIEGKPIALIVEDNADLRAYIREYIDREYSVYETDNGKLGFDRATELVPDIVISDVMMPNMDGFELCRALKRDIRTSHIPVVLLTARAGTESKLEGLESGADDYVTKPFDSRELVVRVKNLIEQRRNLRKKFSAGVVLKPGEVAVTSLDDTLLKNIISVVEQRISDENLSVDDLARSVFLSRAQLNRKLHSLTNLSPAEFIRYIRLQRARELLEKRAGTITDIAYGVGFGSPSYFSASFHERFGVRPSDIYDRNRSAGAPN